MTNWNAMKADLFFLDHDGSTLAWSADKGELFCSITPADEGHQHRWVMQPEQLAPMLLATLKSSVAHAIDLPPDAFRLLYSLLGFVGMGDALTADENAG